MVIYTPWSNLKKTGDMDVGQVGFHNPKLVRSILVEKRSAEILLRLRKTKEERSPDLVRRARAAPAEPRPSPAREPLFRAGAPCRAAAPGGRA